MKKVMKNKRILGIIAVGLLAVLLAATGVIASPPVGLNGPPPPVASKITYQGQLTDSVGNPLSGNYDMEFQFWTALGDGSQAGSTIAKSDVEVVNGLFSVKLEVDQSDFNGQGLWLQIRVRPSGGSWDDWMTPRQQILPVPYALSLKPGAIIEGDSAYGLSSITTDSYGLYGESNSPSMGAGVRGANTGGVGDGVQAVSDGRAGIMALGEGASTYGGYFISDNRIGVYGTTSSDDTEIPAIKGENTGHGYGVLGIGSYYDSIGVYGQSGFGTGVRGEGETGVWGESSLGPGVVGKGVVGVQGMSDTGTGVYGYSTSGTAVSAGGTGVIESTADSYIFISGNELIKNVDTDSTRWDCLGGGSVKIWRGSTLDDKFIYIPVTLPGVLYGQNIKVESITIYYKCQDGTKNYICLTCLWKRTGAESFVEVVTDWTDRTSNTATTYTLPLTANNILSSDQGILDLHLRLHFEDDTNYIQFGGARLRLGHD